MFTLGAIACPSCASSLLAIEFHASPDGLDGTGRLRCPACSARLNVTIKLAVVPAPKPAPDPAPPDGLEDLEHVTGRPPDLEHKCGICDASFDGRVGLAAHARTHETPAPCQHGCGKMIKPSGVTKHMHHCTGAPPTSGRAGVATAAGTPPAPPKEEPPSPPTPAPTAPTPGPTTTPPAKAPAAAADGSDAPAPKAPRPASLTSPPAPKSSSSSTPPRPPSTAPSPSPAAPATPTSPPTPSAPTAGTAATTSRAAAPPTAPSRPTPTTPKRTTTKRGTSPRPDPAATADEAYSPGPPLAGRSRGTCGFYYGPSAGVCGVTKDPGDDPWRRIRKAGQVLDLCPAHADLDDDELADAIENLARPA